MGDQSIAVKNATLGATAPVVVETTTAVVEPQPVAQPVAQPAPVAEPVAAAFIIELNPLKGREKIEAAGVKVVSMLDYDLD